MKPRVALVSMPYAYVNAAGGQGSIVIWNAQVAPLLTKDFDVTIFAPSQLGLRRPTIANDVTYAPVSLRLDRRLTRLLGVLKGTDDPRDQTVCSLLFNPFYALQIAVALRRGGFSIVHLHNYSQFVPIIRLLNPRIRIILHMHCEWLSQLPAAVIEPRLHKTQAVLGCSRHVVDKVRQRFDTYAGMCEAVYNGVDPARFEPNGYWDSPASRQHRTLLYVGRMSPEKGVHVLLEAFEALCRRMPDVQLTMIGAQGQVPAGYLVSLSEDPRVRNLARFYDAEGYWPKLQRQMDRPALRGRVACHDAIDHNTLPGLYRKSYALIQPSLSEAFGIPLVEAMSSGIPVVASRVGGMPEIVQDGRCGRLVEPDDPAQLAEAIERLLDDHASARQMGRAGRQRVTEQFTWQSVADRVIGVYRSLL